jgi:hypothetical protein
MIDLATTAAGVMGFGRPYATFFFVLFGLASVAASYYKLPGIYDWMEKLISIGALIMFPI